MIENTSKNLILFDTDKVSVYKLEKKDLILLSEQQIFFNETLVNQELLKKISNFFDSFKNIGLINNKTTRIYAIGVFQEFSKEQQQQIIIDVYVKSGLYFNIIEPDLEKFYLEKSMETNKEKNLIKGLISQEFRTVVICGSFQQNMKEIGMLMDKFKKMNIKVLSPWTKNIVPLTIGTDFILLEGQELENERDAWRHKFDHMNKFIKADAVIVCNPNGRVGRGTMFEFGFMISHCKRIIFTEEPKDISILFPYEIGLNF